MIREEFKLIMQVVFSLSEHDLKTELQDSDVPKRGSKKKDKHLFQIKCQSQDEIRAEFDPDVKGRETITSSLIEMSLEEELENIIKKYKQPRVKELIKFFFVNKKLLNTFITIDQSVINEQF